MAELRWNPLLRTWTMVAANRQTRPHLPKNWCPFCPGSGKVPDEYEVFAYNNDFPALTPEPEPPQDAGPGPYRVAANYGKCEVILYSPDHLTTLPQLPVIHIVKLLDLWAERCLCLGADEKIKCLFPFENRGEEVGVTMPHPHGQLYAYPYIPQKIQVELDSCRNYFQEHHRCLLCDMNQAEQAFRQRVILENEDFLAYLPHFTDYPHGVFVVGKNHRGSLAALDAGERESLARILKGLTGAFDTLFEKPLPYMMCLHQTPVNSPEYQDVEQYYHFHIEFYTPLREAQKIKFYASSEMGAWAACNPMSVEDTARDLRAAWQIWQDREGGE